ncbi:MAG: hypothetical protein KBG00_10570 [Rhodoferax sp.]|jgi:hypothetical protein|uniref:hypothetical protein n=1 Tax=Rhodoferax sp. TaxID=50421 RepID=UPI001B67AA3A|nr:hypothetical protein [Rhodoferax sp.]MBP9149212.1 hypothetical protein [Rhodoferax sp.]MBP9736163.1 hypothetical protein [Rhodoferax sp.]
MIPAEIIIWSEQQESAGVKDAMGHSFTSWLLAVKHSDGTMLRDKDGHQVFQTQAEFKRIQFAKVGQTMELFV